jgi:hypothetical protein
LAAQAKLNRFALKRSADFLRQDVQSA